MRVASGWLRTDADAIGNALATEGGHLFVHDRGYTLHLEGGATLGGFRIEAFKAACVAAGLPVIDTRTLDPVTAFRLAARTPMVAIARPANPPPWTGTTWAPLRDAARLFRAGGAEVLNLDLDGADAPEVAR